MAEGLGDKFAEARAYLTRPGKGGSKKDVNLPAEGSQARPSVGKQIQQGYGILKNLAQPRSATKK